MGTRRGVEVRETSIRIHFSTEAGMQKRTLKVGGKPMPPTPANVRYAERLAAEIREKVRHGTFVMVEYFPDDGDVGRGLTVSSQLDTWIAAQRLAPSTRKAYRSAARFWTDAIGDEPLRRLRLSQVLTPLAEADISGKTANNYVSVLRKAVALAVADGLVTANVVDGVPAQAHQRPPVDPFSEAEEEAIVSTLAEISPMLADEVRFRFWTGLRTAEHVALTWGQVLDRALLIDRSIVRGVVKSTKTDRARTVRLNSAAAAALERQRQRATADRVWLDPRYNQPWSDPELFRELYWAPALAAAGVRYRRPYNCRHTYATRMLMRGLKPAFCAGQLGHGVLVFAEIYARWMPGHQDDAEMALLERRIPGTSPEPPPKAEGDGSRTIASGLALSLNLSPGVPATYGWGRGVSPVVPTSFPRNFPKESHVIADESEELCLRTVKALKDEDPDYDKHPAVVVGPQWWVEKLKAAHGAGGTDLEIEEFCGCKFVLDDNASGPALVAADGRTWSLLPKWLRAGQALGGA